MTTTATTSARTIVEGDTVLYHGSITHLNGLMFHVTAVNGETLNLVKGTIHFGRNTLQGVRLQSVTKIKI
jgi:hypothetical protein